MLSNREASKSHVRESRSAGKSPPLTIIIVNTTMQTNIPNIYAAGSCALTPAFLARNWVTAAEQGQVAALNMLGMPTPYHPDMLEKLEPLMLEMALS